jgi:hypothetical protein
MPAELNDQLAPKANSIVNLTGSSDFHRALCEMHQKNPLQDTPYQGK